MKLIWIMIIMSISFTILCDDSVFYESKNYFYNANMYYDKSEFCRSIEEYQIAFNKYANKPDKAFAMAKLCYAQSCWAIGDYETGFKIWHEYIDKDGTRPALMNPLKKEDLLNLSDLDILVIATDGLGDIIAWFEYVEVLKELGVKKVIVQVPGCLKEILSRTNIADDIISNKDPKPLCDREVYLMSLPHFISRRGAYPVKTYLDFPKLKGFISALDDRVNKWQHLIESHIAEAGGKMLPIVICPKSSDIPIPGGRLLQRNIPLKSFFKLTELNCPVKLYNILAPIRGYCLTQEEYNQLNTTEQKHRQNDVISQEQLQFLYEFDNTFDERPFEDTLAFMTAVKNCGGIAISAVTSIPHLFGAANLPTLMLHPFFSDSRWGEQCPGGYAVKNRFYESVLDFYQREQDDWDFVMDNIIHYLSN